MTKRFARPTPSNTETETQPDLAHTVSALKKMLMASGLDRGKVDAMINKASRADEAGRSHAGGQTRARSSNRAA